MAEGSSDSFLTRLKEWGIFLAVLAALWFVFPLRGMDVAYKAGWILVHWNDSKRFPPKSELCMQIKCIRADTREVHVGGRPGYTSEFSYPYCPEHKPISFVTDSRFDGFIAFWYWIIAAVISAMIFVPLVALAVRVCAWPGLIPLAATGRVPSESLLPKLEYLGDTLEREPKSWADKMDRAAAIGGLVLLAMAWLMFMWW